jgi:CubicO group peptidase (beta-lactamase class C family)
LAQGVLIIVTLGWSENGRLGFRIGNKYEGAILMIRALSCVIAIGMFVGTVHAAVFPGKHWETRTPAQVGMDATKLDAFAAAVGNRRGCIIKDGYQVYTWGDITSKLDWASAMKPVMSTMLFFAVHEGKLPSVDALVNPYVEKALGKRLNIKDQTMTFRHLANMVSGYGRVEAPGEAWAYNDWAISLYLKALFDGVFEENADSAAQRASRLGTLQIEDGTFFGSRKGYGLLMSARDFARIGWFWLNKGNWSGKQILPRAFFDNYMSADVPADLQRSKAKTGDYLSAYFTGGGTDQTSLGPGIYGFNWWFNTRKKVWPDAPEDTFQANGHWNGEVCCVIPSLGIVATWQGSGTSTDTFNQPMNDYLKILVGSVARNSAVPSLAGESVLVNHK